VTGDAPLHARTALVTGGGRGLGHHIAIGLAEAGAADAALAAVPRLDILIRVTRRPA